jgi:hypothetical protein
MLPPPLGAWQATQFWVKTPLALAHGGAVAGEGVEGVVGHGAGAAGAVGGGAAVGGHRLSRRRPARCEGPLWSTS